MISQGRGIVDGARRSPASIAWTDVCAYEDLLPDRGVAALVHGEQVAVFRLSDGVLHAIGNFDPIGSAFVLSRGLVGSRGDRAVVFSPLYKQAYDLATGRCLDDPEAAVPTYPVRARNGRVYVGSPGDGHPGDDGDAGGASTERL
jgi:nitrite reductase (NADH) small subunit